jgi:hypothetical protein
MGNFPARTQFELSYQIEFQRVATRGIQLRCDRLQCASIARRSVGTFLFNSAASGTAESTSGTVELRPKWAGVTSVSERVTWRRTAAPRLSLSQSGSEEAADVGGTVRARRLRFSLATEQCGPGSICRRRGRSASLRTRRSQRFAMLVAAIEGVELYPGANGEKLSGYEVLITDPRGGPFRSAARATRVRLNSYPRNWRPLVTIEKTPSRAIAIGRRDSPTLQARQLRGGGYQRRSALRRGCGGDGSIQRARLRGCLPMDRTVPFIVEKSAGRFPARPLAVSSRPVSTLVYRVGFSGVHYESRATSHAAAPNISEVSAATTGVLPPVSMSAAGQKVRIEGPGGFRHAGEAGRRRQAYRGSRAAEWASILSLAGR